MQKENALRYDLNGNEAGFVTREQEEVAKNKINPQKKVKSKPLSEKESSKTVVKTWPKLGLSSNM